MVLIKFVETKSWIIMDWEMTYELNWNRILHTANKTIQNFTDLKIVTSDIKDQNKKDVTDEFWKNKKNLMVAPFTKRECDKFNICGINPSLGCVVNLTFFTNTKKVQVYIPRSAIKDYDLDHKYMALSKAFGPFLDSIEIMGYIGVHRNS